MHQYLILLLLLFSVQSAFSQNIYSSDGHDMGPRIYFLEVCAPQEIGQARIDSQNGYSTMDFCNCLADDLIPLLTKKEINYYFAQNHHVEIFKDTTLSKIASLCMINAVNNWKQTSNPPSESSPPPSEVIVTDVPTHSLNDTVIINEILRLVNYESKFYHILEDQLKVLGSDSSIKPQKIKEIEAKITYDVISQPVIFNKYKEYSTEDLQMILEYFESMTSEELTISGVRYEQHIIDYFNSKIGVLIKDEMNQ